MLGMTTQPMWEQIRGLHADWMNSRPLDQSVPLSVFLDYLSQALDVGLVEIQVSCDRPATQAGDQIVVGEWNLTGDLDSLRAALKAPEVVVGGVVHG